MWRLPEALRSQLARPLGPVLPAKEAVSRARKARILCTVGDVTTAAFLEEGLKPRVMVVDNQTKRGPVQNSVQSRLPAGVPVLNVDNPPATITDGLWQAIAGSIAHPSQTLIQVHGEEDLAVLPCVALAPQGTIVAYGQPDQGIVLLNVDDAARERVRDLLKHMEAS